MWPFHFGDAVMQSTAWSSTRMAEDSKLKCGRDRVFALDWRGLAEKGVLGDVLRLFSYRREWLSNGDPRAYSELARAGRAADPNIRKVAELLLSETALDRPEMDSGSAAAD